ncbi:MAG TPA: 3-dehydroquinate synthase II [Syntrophobacteraceae bacterium]|nr:3-dehydroquinate synthase II [Syntrophobacteraceae bacterium]
MKEAWVKLDRWSKRMVTAALEAGADALVVPAGWQERIKELGRIITVGDDGDLKPGREVFFEPLASPEDEARIAGLLRTAPVVVEQSRWEVIPLENLVASGGKLLVTVDSLENLDLALGILEKGVAGVVILAEDVSQLKTMIARVKSSSEPVALRVATVDQVVPVGMGDRVCVDTCTSMQDGDGMLVGNFSHFLFLVQAETRLSPYVAPRPFRVNAGAVHAYVQVPGRRTRYLSELSSGDGVLIASADGRTQTAVVGRAKIERRPLLLVCASCEGITGSIVLQNAETIRLTDPTGDGRSVAALQPGDQVLVVLEGAGRHFGVKVDETIWEQ